MARLVEASRDAQGDTNQLSIPAVSVIVPVFNAEASLPKCLGSIVNQTLANVEIVLVNDGSHDQSGGICHRYAAGDPRIRVIDKENGGLASARKAGLALATGEYVGFVDADDWIERNMYDRMYRVGSLHGCDIVFCNVFRNDDEKQKPHMRGGLYERKEIDEEIFPRLLAVCDERSRVGVLRWSNCLRIYRHELIKKHNIDFDGRFRRCQDLPFTFECTIFANRYYYLDQDYLYHNSLNFDSLSRGYTENMWALIKPLVLYLYDVVKGYSRYDFSKQMDLRAFLFALDCAENETKPGNPQPLVGRLRRIRAIMSDPLVRHVLRNLDPVTMIPRTRVYYESFRMRVALPAYLTARWRYRHHQDVARRAILQSRECNPTKCARPVDDPCATDEMSL